MAEPITMAIVAEVTKARVAAVGEGTAAPSISAHPGDIGRQLVAVERVGSGEVGGATADFVDLSGLNREAIEAEVLGRARESGERLSAALRNAGAERPEITSYLARNELPPVTENSHDTLRERGASEQTIGEMGNDAEAQIYINADLKPMQVNGKEVLARADIDLNQTDFDGDTNLERMQKGKPPLGEDGKPIELHHIGQKQDSALAELTRAEHREGGNDRILHDKQKETEIDRADFDKERQAHWKARAEQMIVNSRGEDA